MSDNTTFLFNTEQIQSLPNILFKKKISKHTFTIQPKTSGRRINNNIKEKLFQLKLNNYEAKQKELLNNFIELNKIYRKCVTLSKTVSLPKNKHLEDIEYVVARIVSETYCMRRSIPTGSETCGKKIEQQYQDVVNHKEWTTPFGIDDLRVWDPRSRHDAVMDSIANKLLDVYARFWIRIEKGIVVQNEWVIRSAGSAEPLDDRVPSSQSTGLPELRDFVDIVVTVRDALSENYHRQHDDVNSPKTLENLAAAESKIHSSQKGSLQEVDGILMQANGQHFRVDGQSLTKRQKSIRELRKNLALVTDRLKAVDKEKRDLMVAVHRIQLDPSVISLQAILEKEKEKNVYLQSLVDKMFAATKTTPNDFFRFS